MTSLKNYVEFKEKCDGNKYSLNLSFLGKKKTVPICSPKLSPVRQG